jgi:hypothetical protein
MLGVLVSEVAWQAEDWIRRVLLDEKPFSSI